MTTTGTHLATLGPCDQPNGKVEVCVIRPHDMPGFFVCADERGRRLVVHGQKLKNLDEAATRH